MKRNTFKVLFFIKKTKLLKNGEASVCMRITVNGARAETNIRKSVEPALWNQAKECVKGKSRKACDLNTYLENARIRLHQLFCEMEEQGLPITARLLQASFFGQEKDGCSCRNRIIGWPAVTHTPASSKGERRVSEVRRNKYKQNWGRRIFETSFDPNFSH